MTRKKVLTSLPDELVAALDVEVERLNEGKKRSDPYISRSTLIELMTVAFLGNPPADREYHVKVALGIWRTPPA